MNKQCTRKDHAGRWHLTLIFALTVFLILLLTILIAVSCTFLLDYHGIISISTTRNTYIPILGLAAFSLVLGAVLAAIFSRIPLRPINEIISATEKLAAGDFSTRIHLKTPPEFQRLSESFNHMAKELGGTEMLRNDFVNSFSHEFKTPIISIRGYARMLKYDDLSPTEREQYLDIILRESDRLSQLATNVLNLSKLENQEILSNRKNYNLSEQIRLATAVIMQKWAAKDPIFSFDCEEIIFCGDEALLHEVWINLLDNAVKFSGEGPVISMRIEEREDGIFFTVSDNGPGMDAETADRIFEKFYQGDESRTTSGNGLGLTIAKRIVTLHGGTIRHMVSSGIGMTFVVTLPASEPEMPVQNRVAADAN